jgi:hypothetical protein
MRQNLLSALAMSDGATYIEMMRSNTAKITEALKDCAAG